MARSVLCRSKDDAAIYFEDAINIVSRFGDELVERWEALDALGEKSAAKSSDELAYRFIRCAELVGDTVYREKHWDRSGALITCSRMSPQIGISALSRWRDREIGRFEYQLRSLLFHLVESGYINSTQGWSMARLLSDHELIEFLDKCLVKEAKSVLRTEILSDAYELLRKEGCDENFWAQLKSIADKYNININELNHVVDFYGSTLNQTKSEELSSRKKPKNENAKWNRIFNKVDIFDPRGIEIIRDRFSHEFQKEKDNPYWDSINLYREILSRIEYDQIESFIEIIFSSKDINYYQSLKVLKSFPKAWRDSVSFKNKWALIMFQFGVKYSHKIVSRYSFSTITEELKLDDHLIAELRKGIFKGLSEGQEINNASVLFGFVRHASEFISSNEACESIDFALSRFEMHIDDDFGDGPWSEWLYVSNDINKNIAGFIWSALGSPSSQMRWQACHVVKKMADFNCYNILNELVDWMKYDKVDAFGSNYFPFYNLHARQYLLIALRRVSIDNPELLVGFKDIFIEYSRTEPHVLVQKFSSEIAINIERAISGTYKESEVSFLRHVGKSGLPSKKEKFGYKVDSYLHTQGLVDLTLNFHFGWDFDRYWYQPLGEVFGVSGKQIEEICANTIISDWGIEFNGGSINDPRSSLWNSSRDQDTWHDHGRYPKTDNLAFYYSYHAMLVTAAKLIENMPVINSRDYYEDAWDSWLSGHLLTRIDGKWLADCRDPLPLQRPRWLEDGYKSVEWREKIEDEDFIRSIKIQKEKENWIVIKGGWTERKSSRYESYSVSTALVTKKSSGALLNALSTCSDGYDYKIPDYNENRVEFDLGIFWLKGFILNPDRSHGIDEYDPYGMNLEYPYYSLGPSVAEKLKLTSDSEGKTWYLSDDQNALKCETWSSKLQGYDDEPEQSGMQLIASTNLLKKICRAYNSHLIIDINISRDIEYKSRSEKDNYEYLKHHKLYLFSENGRLSSTTENYQLRRDNSK